MQEKRLFVGNLPEDVTEEDIKTEFSAYGSVVSVELKSKKNAFDEINRFAFVSIALNDRELQQCIQEFKDQKYKGNYLSVSIAKESFLDRLNREREEAKKLRSTTRSAVPSQPKPEFKRIPVLPTFSSVNDKDEESSDSSDENDELTERNQHNESRSAALLTSEQKRADSLNKMADAYKQKKLLIKSALSKVDTSKNKIKFDYDGEDNTTAQKSKNNYNRSKTTLFNDDDNDNSYNYENDFKIKEQFQGAKGQKLLELQSKYKNDKRFQMDEKFHDGEEEAQVDNDKQMDVTDENNERDWQINILENVVGKKFDQSIDNSNFKKPNNVVMTRYDPTRADHANLLYENPLVTKKSKQLVNEPLNIDDFEVSKETYYKISNDFTKTFEETENQSFSLLNMFGNIENSEQTNLYEETALSNKKSKNKFEKNPFKYDSSDSEPDTDIPVKAGTKKINETKEIFHETFFIHSKDDSRLLDGANFFRVVSEHDDFNEMRGELKKVVRNKIKKSKNNLSRTNKNRKFNNKTKKYK